MVPMDWGSVSGLRRGEHEDLHLVVHLGGLSLPLACEVVPLQHSLGNNHRESGTPQHSLPLYPAIWARAVVFTRSSPLFGREGGQKWLQMHLCSAAVPFLSPSVLLFHQLLQKKPTDDSVKKEPVTGEKLYKAFLFLSMKAMAKLCLPGASQMRG